MASKGVLAGTDLSARSDRAIDRALQLGKEFELPVQVIHVPESGSAESTEALVAAVRSVLPDPACDVEILTPAGPLPQAIAEAAKAGNAALIATGVARFNTLGDYTLGTAVDKIIGQAPAPVLIVKHRPHAPYARLLCAVDFSDHSGRALTSVLELFPDREVIALHAFHVPFESWQKDAYVREQTEADVRKEFEGFLDRLSLTEAQRRRIDARIGYGGVAEVIKKEIEETGADLVVFGTHGLGGFRQATIGSIASSLLQTVRPDVLVVPPA